tara:strand:- start:42 stop:392 length:351 start_codon:yes stop_codon:yes gene_type:complete
MATKQELLNYVKEWIKVDNEIKVLQSEIKTRRVQKNNLSDTLVTFMKDNEIDCFDLNEGKIMYTSTKVKSPLSKKYLLESLSSYFNEIPNIDSNDVAEFVLDNRNIKIKEGIRHKS